jgi:hypothetical protein
MTTAAKRWLYALGAVVGLVALAWAVTWIYRDFRGRYADVAATPCFGDIPCWGWVVALLPAALVGFQGLQLILVKRLAVQELLAEQSGERNPKGFQTMRKTAKSLFDRYFDPLALSVQYCLFTLVLALVTLMVFGLCLNPPNELFKAEMSPAPLRLGAAGAYTYVLIDLGRRTFLRDITGARYESGSGYAR